MKHLITTLCLAMATTLAAVADTYIGYSNTHFERTGGVRMGSTLKQGQAIRLPKGKLDMMRGKQIKGVRAVFGTSHMDSLTFFVATSLDGPAIYTQTATGGTAAWRNFIFDTPFTIGNEDELYIGYTLTASTSYYPLQYDKSNGVAGCSYHFTAEGWQDSFSQDYGCANLLAIVDGDFEFTDIVTKSFPTTGYYLATQPYTYTGQVLNFGTTTISSFDVEFHIGDTEPQTYSFSNVSIAPNSTFDFNLPEYTAQQSGGLDIEMRVTRVNGIDADADMSDNAVANTLYMYPADIRRAVLLEGFTGQSCVNCPGGHQYINTALSQYSGEVIEIFHHIGYYPDNFTMSEESFYLNFYGGSTFAPAFMVNRMPGNGSTSPAQNISVGGVLTMLNLAAAQQPYFEVEIASAYDAATRRVTGNVNVFPHVLPDADTLMLSLLIVQDSIVASQSGGSGNYVHRYAYRGSLYHTIGVRIYPEQGQWLSMPIDYELPDSIFSTYYEGYAEQLPSIVTDPAQMYLVAIVSKYRVDGDGNVDCPVYNADMVKMCAANAATGIGGVADGHAEVTIDVNGGRISVVGECLGIAVYDMAGRMVQSFDASTTEFTLPRGLYIVRAKGANATTTHKVAVRD